jgi:hypothetical protein
MSIVFVKITSHLAAMSRPAKKVLMEESHYSGETKSSSITRRHAGPHNRCRSENMSLSAKRHIVFISHKTPDDVLKNDPSHDETAARGPGAMRVSAGGPGAGRVARTRVTGSNRFDICSRVCDVRALPCMRPSGERNVQKEGSQNDNVAGPGARV